MHAAALQLLGAPSPSTTSIYPWTLVADLAQGSRPRRMGASALAARCLLAYSAPRRTHLRWLFAHLALTTWVSRHLTGEEALASAVSVIYFGPGARGIREASDRYLAKATEQLDAEEVARLLVLTQAPAERRSHPDSWRAARDHLLREMRRSGFIDEATLATSLPHPLPVEPIGPHPSAGRETGVAE